MCLKIEYMVSSREQRLYLLAGIIDGNPSYHDKNKFIVRSKSKNMIKDIIRLALSLGFESKMILNGNVMLESFIFQFFQMENFLHAMK